MSFKLENPVQITRGTRRVSDPRVEEALEFASANRGQWFVYETETLESGAASADVTKSRARVTMRTGRLRDAAKRSGVTLEITTRKDGTEMKGYVRAVETKTEDGK